MLNLIVEFLGTMLISFVLFSSGGNYVAIGVTLSIAILLGKRVSEAAYNPAIAIALFYAKKLSVTELVPYIIAEIAGGVAGYEVFKMLV
jgi:glycerol uptake facilitator-like aquaporin